MIETMCVDLDGILVDFHKAAIDFYGLDPKLFDTSPRPLPWLWLWQYVDKPYDSFWEEITEDFWSNMDWTPEGRETLRMIEERFGRDNVFLLSNPSDHDATIIGKRKWIRKHLPQYRKRTLLGEAKEACAGTPNNYLVDDSDININRFIRRHGTGILFPRMWNTAHAEERRWKSYLEERLFRNQNAIR